MSYLKINGIDFSSIVNELKVETKHNYNSQTNAAGDSVVDYINKKRVIEVGVISIDDQKMKQLLSEVDKFNVSVSYRNPKTNLLEENVLCIIDSNAIEYYTIQINKVMYKELSLKFVEL